MPKLKTHKGAKARFSVTGTGKVMRRRIGNSHLRRKKPKKVRRAYIGKVPVSGADAKRIKEFIPYAG
jgi:large subunit ribosomal protein L35